MRIFELMLILAAFISSSAYLFNRIRNYYWATYMPFTAMPIFLLHYFIEGTRWQMYPVYLLSVLLIFASVYKILSKSWEKHKGPGIFRIARNTFIWIMLAVSLVSCIILPVGGIPKPSGQFKTGTMSFYIEDKSRKEIYSNNSSDYRKFMIQMWYPAKSVNGLKRAPWLENGDIVSKGLSRLMKLPDFALSHLALVKSNSYESAELSDTLDKYPVIIISHGWTGFRDIHINIAEMLASYGYIVVAIDHTYGSIASVLNNSQAVFLNPNALPSGIKGEELLKYGSNLVDTYAHDTVSTINTLEKFNSGDERTIFENRLDMNRIGVLGHSTGGGGSVEASILDPRIKAVFGLDPWVEPLKLEYIQKGLKVPAVFLRSEQWENKPNNKNLFELMDKSSSDIQLYEIKGIVHDDFTIVNIVSPALGILKLKGSLDSKTSMEIQQDYVLSFFNKYIKDEDNNLLEQQSSPFSEVNSIYRKDKEVFSNN